MTSHLRSDTKLCRAPGIRIDLPSPDRVSIRLGDTCLTCPSATLTVLEMFAYPTALADGLDRLAACSRGGALEWVELSKLVQELFEAGILIDDSGMGPALESKIGFGAPPIHAKMLNDTRRTDAYLRAIREVIKDGDVVLDLGTGTGVLATAAARAGAAHVYAIEATTIGEAAKEVFAANGCADHITLVPGWSARVELPERVDVMISEIIGNDPLGEFVREMTWDAQRRFLKPDARMIPAALTVMAQAVEIPDAFRDDNIFTGHNTAAWTERYGLDFHALLASQRNTVTSVNIHPHLARDWTRVGDPVAMVEFPMEEVEWSGIRTSQEIVACQQGRIDGVVEYFIARLSNTVTLADDPWTVDNRCSWQVRVWLLPIPVTLEAGQAVHLHYRHSIPGERDGISFSGARTDGNHP